MAKAYFPVDNFNLASVYACEYVSEYDWGDIGNAEVFAASNPTQSTIATKTVTFNFSLPSGAKVKSAKVFATLGTPDYGAYFSTINDVSVGTSATVSVDVPLADNATSVDVKFSFKCNNPSHAHGANGTVVGTHMDGNVEIKDYKYSHTSTLEYTNVYLQIEYEGKNPIYRSVDGVLIPYKIYCAENGTLVPYQLYRGENGELVSY